MLKEFKEFAFGGNLIELAVAFVMAGAIGALIGALVEHIIMPIVGIIFGQPNFDDVLDPDINDSIIRFGSFLTALVTFAAIAFGVYFFVVKPYQKYKEGVASGTEESAPPPEDLDLLRQIAANTAK